MNVMNHMPSTSCESKKQGKGNWKAMVMEVDGRIDWQPMHAHVTSHFVATMAMVM